MEKVEICDKHNTSLDPNSSSEMLELLATDENVQIRLNVANNPNTSIKTLLKLYSKLEYRDVLSVVTNRLTELGFGHLLSSSRWNTSTEAELRNYIDNVAINYMSDYDKSL